ncbi:MAG: CPBP family intramembrane metalloprotease [Candidatus Odinarchaeota archaeon]|nr:CPBP family intramembrane metalloprotease [Candidatus Odinarchaeota archaeon]
MSEEPKVLTQVEILFDVIVFIVIWTLISLPILILLQIIGMRYSSLLLPHTVIIVYLALKRYKTDPFKAIGFEISKAIIFQTIIYSIIGGFLLTVIVLIFILLNFASIHWVINYTHLNILVIPIIDTLLSAGVEELIFRGYIVNVLSLKFSERDTILLSAFFFAFMHLATPAFNLIAFFHLFIAGIALAIIYLKTHSIYTVIAFHFSWNFFEGEIFGLPVSGHASEGILIVKVINNAILTGGAYGPEGGLIGLFIIGIFTIILYVIYSKE